MAIARQGGCYGGVFTLAFSAAVLLCFLIQPTVAWTVVSVEDFTVANLGNKSAKDHTITYDIKFKNFNKRQAIHYEKINFKFYYMHNNDKLYIGNATFSGFRQSFWGGSVHRVGKFEPTRSELNNATAPEETFRVEIEATYRREILYFFRSSEMNMNKGADLKVNYLGELENKEERLVRSSAIRNTLKSSPFTIGGILLAVYYFLSM